MAWFWRALAMKLMEVLLIELAILADEFDLELKACVWEFRPARAADTALDAVGYDLWIYLSFKVEALLMRMGVYFLITIIKDLFF